MTINIKNFDPILLQIDKKLYEESVFTTLDILQLKKLIIVKYLQRKSFVFAC